MIVARIYGSLLGVLVGTRLSRFLAGSDVGGIRTLGGRVCISSLRDQGCRICGTWPLFGSIVL